MDEIEQLFMKGEDSEGLRVIQNLTKFTNLKDLFMKTNIDNAKPLVKLVILAKYLKALGLSDCSTSIENVLLYYSLIRISLKGRGREDTIRALEALNKPKEEKRLSSEGL